MEIISKNSGTGQNEVCFFSQKNYAYGPLCFALAEI
jgi:hypothetical protein